MIFYRILYSSFAQPQHKCLLLFSGQDEQCPAVRGFECTESKLVVEAVGRIGVAVGRRVHVADHAALQEQEEERRALSAVRKALLAGLSGKSARSEASRGPFLTSALGANFDPQG
jgi:hypothetical protein